MTNGKERSNADATRELILRMEKEVKSCNPYIIRLIRTATINNLTAKREGQINNTIALKNDQRILATTESFIKNCSCLRKSS